MRTFRRTFKIDLPHMTIIALTSWDPFPWQGSAEIDVVFREIGIDHSPPNAWTPIPDLQGTATDERTSSTAQSNCQTHPVDT